LGIINLNRSSSAEGASLAFNILPGLVGAYFLSRKMPIADFLNGLLRDPAFADDRGFPDSILAVARAHASTLLVQRGRSASRSSRPVPAATKLIRRTERLVRERRTGTAMQTAEQLQDLIDKDLILENTVAPLTTSYSLETVRATLASLCPPASHRDILNSAQLASIAQSTPLTVSAGDVMAVLEKLPIGAAAGASGWTYAVMKALFLRNGDYSDRASLLVATFCNLMLSGQLRSQVWLRTRSVFVPKKNGRPRPLGIGDSWYRFVGRVALSKVGDRVGSALSPVQLGIGVKNGAEIGGRMAQLVFDSEDNLVLLSLDNENGFNTLPRGLICSGLAEFAPELLHWFQYAYGGPSPLFCQGELVAHMATGCKQGDTFGSLLYAVGFQSTLLAVQDSLALRIQDHAGGCSTTGGVSAFIDDTSLFVDGRIADLVAADTISIFTAAGISLCIDKCRFLVPPGTILPPTGLTAFPTVYDGCIILGCPAGTLEYRQQEASAITVKASRPLPAVLRLPSWSALPLIRQCVSARVGYLARVSELATNLPAFLDFDSKIDAAILSIAGVTPREAVSSFWLPTIRSLPLSLFGLGIPRFAGLAGETACLLSREHTYDFCRYLQMWSFIQVFPFLSTSFWVKNTFF